MRHQHRYIQRPVMPGERGVRLLVITPVSPEDGAEGPFPLDSPERSFLLPTTQVDEILCKGSPVAISGEREVQRVTPLILAKACWAEASGYDAIVVNCMVDPGVPELRRTVSIPVIGAGRAAVAVASVLADRPLSIFPGRIRVNALAEDEAYTLKELMSIGRRHVATRGADALTLGCSYLGGAAMRLQDEVGVPVIPTIEVALKIAELIACTGIRPQRLGVPNQRARPLTQWVFREKDRLFGLVERLRRRLRQHS